MERLKIVNIDIVKNISASNGTLYLLAEPTQLYSALKAMEKLGYRYLLNIIWIDKKNSKHFKNILTGKKGYDTLKTEDDSGSFNIQPIYH